MSYFLEVDKTPESVYSQAAAEFVIIELDLAFTFCQLALSTDNLGRADRNINNAKLCWFSLKWKEGALR